MTGQIDLRIKYPEFNYQSSTYELVGEELVVKFKFTIPPDIEFTPQITIPIDVESFRASAELDNLVFHLGLVEMFSYWKATASPLITISAGVLNNQQIGWWHDLIMQGMGEFFYKNQLDFTAADFLTIKSDLKPSQVISTVNGNEISASQMDPDPPVGGRDDDLSTFLVPVGGGKDSALTLGLLNKWNKKLTALVVNPTPAALSVIKASEVGQTILVKRTIDPRLLELNKQSFYNGHTPFSAYLAFLSLLVARIYQIPQIALSNENSANEGNTNYLGQNINHQYSKTYTFEKTFREYVSAYLPADINYFSFLRPLHELQIAKLFASLPTYFDKIVSCNKGGRAGIWCGECPKCVSTFTILYPFLGPDNLGKIFGKNLFDHENLWPRIVELIDPNVIRPFECVGGREELLIALYLSTQIHRGDRLPELLRLVKEKYLDKELNLDNRAKSLFTSWDEYNFLPRELMRLLKKETLKFNHDLHDVSLRGA